METPHENADDLNLQRAQAALIRRALELHSEMGAAAKALGINRSTLRRKIEKWQIAYVKYPRRKTQ